MLAQIGLGLLIVLIVIMAVRFVVGLFPGFGNDPDDTALLPPADYTVTLTHQDWTHDDEWTG